MNYYNVKSLIFKNGEWLKNPSLYVLPFEYADGGVIHTVNGEKLYGKIKWFHREYVAMYTRDGLPYMYTKTLKGLIVYLKWIFGLKYPCGYFKEVGVYEKDDVTVYIFRDFPSQINVSFYKDDTDTYICFGEGDCCRNILTGLLDQGYEDEFEQGIAAEIYNWCYDNALTWVSDLLHKTNNERIEGLRKLQDVFGKRY